jgi:type I site-specific restriction-modification system R (restriction) subunit
MERLVETTASVLEVAAVVAPVETVEVVEEVVAPVEAQVEVTEAEELAIEENHEAEALHTAEEILAAKAGALTAANYISSGDAVKDINAAIRTTIGEDGGAFQKAMEIKHYNSVYKFLKRGEDFSLATLVEFAAKAGYKLDIVATPIDEVVEGLNEANQGLINAITGLVNNVIVEKFTSTKAGEKAELSAEKQAAREAAKAQKEAEKAAKEAEKAAKQAAKEAEKAAKQAAKDAEKAAKDAEKAAAKAAAKAAKDAEKAANEAAANTAALTEPAIAVGEILAEAVATPVLAEAVATPVLAEAVATPVEEAVAGTEDLVAEPAGLSTTDGIKVSLEVPSLN